MSGAGKSALAAEVARIVRQSKNIVLVDGDVVREVWGGDLGYSEADRRINMGRMARLSRWLNSEGVDAVAAVVAPFLETREWNRAHIEPYYEVFIDAPLVQLTARDPKGHYRRALAGDAGLPGVNQTYERPTGADMVIDNSGALANLLAHAEKLADIILKASK